MRRLINYITYLWYMKVSPYFIPCLIHWNDFKYGDLHTSITNEVFMTVVVDEQYSKAVLMYKNLILLFFQVFILSIIYNNGWYVVLLFITILNLLYFLTHACI